MTRRYNTRARAYIRIIAKRILSSAAARAPVRSRNSIIIVESSALVHGLVPSRVPSSRKRSVEAGLTRNCAKYGNANVLSLVACHK